MSPPKVTDEAHINFLIATPKMCIATEAARVQSDRPSTTAHDAFTRLLHDWSRTRPRSDEKPQGKSE